MEYHIVMWPLIGDDCHGNSIVMDFSFMRFLYNYMTLSTSNLSMPSWLFTYTSFSCIYIMTTFCYILQMYCTYVHKQLHKKGIYFELWKQYPPPQKKTPPTFWERTKGLIGSQTICLRCTILEWHSIFVFHNQRLKEFHEYTC